MEAVMKNNTRLILRRAFYIGITALLVAACSAVGVGSSTVQHGILQLDNGIVKVQDQKGNWQPLAGDSTFELVGTLESLDPWKVAGRALQRNDATQIAQGLKVGDLVRVRGAVLGDENWLAYSIEPVQEQTNQAITIVGKVTSVDPWVVNGITLHVTEDTVINGDIKTGTLARVDILLQDDGTWDVLSIAPVGELPTTAGCATVIATVASVSGNQVQFLGWPGPVTVGDTAQPTMDNNTATNDNNNDDNDNDENDNEGNDGEGVHIATLEPGQQVLAVVCSSGNNQFVITKLTVLNNGNNDEDNGGEKVLVCHKPAKKGGHTISISSSAVPAHLGHGDKLGACP